MGFRGLETFIDSIYIESKKHLQNQQNQIFKLKKLSELKLVVDGNDLIHAFCEEIYPVNQYSGNYNQLYIRIKQLLKDLKPQIELVIFNGYREEATKAYDKHQIKIKKLTNELNQPNDMYLKVLKSVPPLFMRNLMFEILNELKIQYSLSEGMGDHAIACYANGHNQQGKKFTVCARNSYYYAYNLKNGYLSIKYFIQHLKDLNQSTKVPVFNMIDLLEYLNLRLHKTWLYFCLILGDYNLDVERNVKYLKLKRINSRNNNLIEIVNHLRQLELKRDDFSYLRSTYSQDKLKLIDKYIDLFEFKNTDFELIISDETSIVNDFDRFVLNIKNLNQCYLPCLVEDYSEKTVFHICQQNSLLKHFYSFYTDKIEEFSRAQLPSRDLMLCNQVNTKINSNEFNDNILFYLKDLNKLNSASQVDNMSLFMVSLTLWYDWLTSNIYTQKLNYPLTPDLFINAIIYNLIIIKLKRLDSNENNTRYDSLLSKIGSNESDLNNTEILSLYEKILNGSNENGSYFSNDIKLVHRLNELQAVYYVISMISRVNGFQFESLSMAYLFDGEFVCRYVQEVGVNETDCFWLSIRLKENVAVDETFKLIRDEFKKCLAFVTPQDVFDDNNLFEKQTNDNKEEQKLADLIQKLSFNK